MGEKSVPSQEPMENGLSSDEDNRSYDSVVENTLDEEDLASEEFEAINDQLDALNCALDDIEKQNDDIHAQLLQLLQSNREIRKQMQKTQDVESMETSS